MISNTKILLRYRQDTASETRHQQRSLRQATSSPITRMKYGVLDAFLTGQHPKLCFWSGACATTQSPADSLCTVSKRVCATKTQGSPRRHLMQIRPNFPPDNCSTGEVSPETFIHSHSSDSLEIFATANKTVQKAHLLLSS